MSEDRTNKDPLLGGLDGMRAGQTWEGAPENLNAGENGQTVPETGSAAADSGQEQEIFSAEEYEVLSADRKELIREISHRVTSIKILVREMTEARKVANHLENYKERAFAYEDKVRPYLDQIRDHIDHLEMEVDDEIWPLPKYRELLFTK